MKEAIQEINILFELLLQHRYIVATATFLVLMISVGYMYGLSRLLPVVIADFKTTRARASVIQATHSAMFWCTSVFAGIAVQRYGAKTTGIIGAVAVALSVSASYFASSVLFLILSHGIVTAIGTSCLAMSGVGVIGNTFKGKTVQLMLSVVLAGCGIGGMAYSYLLEFLLDTYGLQGTFLVIGGIMMNSFPLAICWPPKQPVVKRNTVISKTNSVADSTNRQTHVLKINEDRMDSVKNTIQHIVGVKSFVLFAVGSAITTTSQMTFLIFITDLLIDRQFESSLASLGLFLYNLGTIIGRLAPGTLKQIQHCSSLTVPLLATVLGVAGSVLIALNDNELASFIACSAGGLSFGVISAAMSIVSVTLVGKQNVVLSLGLIFSLCGITTLLSGPVNGYIRDVTESYTFVFLSSAVASGIGGIFFLATLWMELRKRSSKSFIE